MVWDVACLGDLVVDLVPHSVHEGQWLYAPHPGGAPGNVAVGLARLGRKALMLAKLGDEAFGHMIAATLVRQGVDTAGLSFTAAAKTRLSIVTLDDAGDRDFIFYGDSPADLLISADDILPAFVEDTAILHLGGLLMAGPQSSAAQEKAIGMARAFGRLISVDPNFRPSLWADHGAMLQAGRHLVAVAAIVKLSEEELLALSPGQSIESAARALWHDGLKLMAVTLGAAGAVMFTVDRTFTCGGFPVAAVDTTAAGDAFMAALLAGLLDIGMDLTAEDRLASILRSACAAGALAATGKGAMESLPTPEEIAHLLRTGCENPV